jgi:cytochrome bd ubiquinol oxidase subunit I
LLAFFLESTFLGLWIFGWDKLSPRLHLATIWLAAIGTNISAYFILAANSWMQHPVGYRINPETNRAELTSIWKVLTNSTTLVTFPHVLFGAFLTAGVFLIGISAWHLSRGNDSVLFRRSLRFGLYVALAATIGVTISGDIQARIMTEQQPMKMAAAEALYDSAGPASFSLFTIGSLDGGQEVWSLRVPNGLSFMATGSLDGKVEGINDVQRQYEQKYGAGSYKPVIPVTYWSFRLMIGFGFLAGLLALAGLWLTRRGRTPGSVWFTRAALAGMALPFLANTMGWIFTEMGRQPWVVLGVLRTRDGVSTSVGTPSMVISLVVLTVLYAGLAVVAGFLMLRFARLGPMPEGDVPAADEPLPAFHY